MEALDEQALVDDLVAMVRVPSVTGTDAESALMNDHAQRLAALGFYVDLWALDLDDLATHPTTPAPRPPRREGYGSSASSAPGTTCSRSSCRDTSTSCPRVISANGQTATPGAARSAATPCTAAEPVR